MKKLMASALCFLCCLCLTSCGTGTLSGAIDPIAKASSTMVPGVSTLIPEAEEETPLRTQGEALLYYRCRNDACLIAENRTVSRTPSQSWEFAVVNELLSGPSGTAAGLTRLFPNGTRVLSAVKQGRTLFVTLSSELLSGYPDEPIDWQEHDSWRRECPLRRRLCMQSLVATVTENCEIDQVQVLVQQGSVSHGSLRLKQNYFLDDSEDSVLVGPMSRDASLLMGPDASMSLVLSAWRSRDWDRLYQWMVTRDPNSGTARPAQRDFTAQMEQLPHIVNAQASAPSYTADGLVATFAVELELLQGDGTTRIISNRIMRLYNDSGWWKISLEQLTGWLEVAE